MTRLTGRVLWPNDPGWKDAQIDYNQRFNMVQPKVIVFCQDIDDVINAIQWAKTEKIPLRVRSGRHNYEGYSLVQDGLILDVSEIDSVRANEDKTVATVGAGIDMLHLNEALGDLGVMTPLATGPTVGLAGFALGGGFGLTSRLHGFACDNLVSVQLVDASGQVVLANESKNADLFWACRGGGGGNFGVATRFELKLHQLNLVSVFLVEWPWSQVEEVITKWQL